MSKKDSKTSPPRVFSDNDTPTAPVEPSKKSLADAAGKTEFEQKQTHVLYIEFNNKLYEILNSLAVKIPANRKTYASLDKTLRTFAAIDVSRPMEEWNKQTAPYREILQTYSPENVEEFLKIAPKIPLLKAFEIEKYWNLLKPSDIESLWKHFNGLCLLSTTTSAVPVKLMTTLQVTLINFMVNLTLEEYDSKDASDWQIGCIKTIQYSRCHRTCTTSYG